jgi:hypothetical protein
VSVIAAASGAAAALCSDQVPSDGFTNYFCDFILIEMQIICEELEKLVNKTVQLRYCVILLNRLILAEHAQNMKY